jgi:hypothetical protein
MMMCWYWVGEKVFPEEEGVIVSFLRGQRLCLCLSLLRPSTRCVVGTTLMYFGEA